MKLTTEQRVQKANIWLMRSTEYCLYSGVIMMGKIAIEDGQGITAYTNGRDVKYGRDFVDKLDDKELRALILHENLHKAFRHLTLWKGIHKQNPRVANMACDYVINLMIYDSDRDGTEVRLPAGGLLDERFRGMDSGTVFRILLEEGADGADGDALDEHGWGDGEALDEEQLAKDIDQALRQGKMLAGKMGGNIPREVDEALEPKVNWREALAEFISSFCTEKEESTWRRPSRRHVHNDVYMPSMYSESIGRLVVAIDTSGSISGDVISQFLGEVQGICTQVIPEAIDLLYWESTVVGHEKYERDQLDSVLSSTRPVGGGGTDVRELFTYIDERKIKPVAVVVLTDGETPYPESLEYPTLFGMLGNVIAPVGKTIKIN